MLKRLNFGWRLGDFFKDGNFFVNFDDGGGSIRSADTLDSVNKEQLHEHPVHCCPIIGAQFSANGNWIISSDGCHLLLWPKDGKILAELVSPTEQGDIPIRMQSPIFVDPTQKIYAADGYDFLEWDINEIAQRVKRKPQNTPKVLGKVVFSNRKKRPSEPEVMNIAADVSGKNFVAGTETPSLITSSASRTVAPRSRCPKTIS